MMNKRLMITLAFLTSLFLVFSGYSESEAKGPKKLTFANWLPPMNPVSKGFDEWAREFEDKTGGRYKVEVVHGWYLPRLPRIDNPLRGGFGSQTVRGLLRGVL